MSYSRGSRLLQNELLLPVYACLISSLVLLSQLAIFVWKKQRRYSKPLNDGEEHLSLRFSLKDCIASPDDRVIFAWRLARAIANVALAACTGVVILNNRFRHDTQSALLLQFGVFGTYVSFRSYSREFLRLTDDHQVLHDPHVTAIYHSQSRSRKTCGSTLGVRISDNVARVCLSGFLAVGHVQPAAARC